MVSATDTYHQMKAMVATTRPTAMATIQDSGEPRYGWSNRAAGQLGTRGPSPTRNPRIGSTSRNTT